MADGSNLSSLADAASQFHVVATADQAQKGLPSLPVRKTARIQKACLTCRARKHRCSGELPCYNCNATGNECNYPERRKAWKRSSRDVSWLEERVKNLERNFMSQELHGVSTEEVGQMEPNADLVDERGTHEKYDENYEAEDRNDVDGMATININNRSNGSKYLGRSSTAAFMNQVKGLSPQYNTPSPESPSIATPSTRPELSTHYHPVYSDQSEMDRYIDMFFRYSSSIIKILHQQSFMYNYKRYGIHRTQSTLWGSLVFAVSAVGAIFSFSKEDWKKSETYMDSAISMIPHNHLDTANLRLTQIYIMIAHHSQASNNLNRLWSSIGMAIRIAQSLGLHLKSSKTKENCIISECKKRAWYACVNFDIVASMTLGRPFMLGDRIYEPDLPTEVDDIYITADVIQPQPLDHPSQTSFFVQSIKLYRILSRIVRYFYSKESLNDDAEDFQEMLKIEKRLFQWRDALPHFLQFHKDHTRTNPSVSLRQLNVLHCRYLNARMLLFRPSLRVYRLDSGATEGLESVLNQIGPDTCLGAAKALISIIHENHSPDNSGAWWYNVFYTATAMTVILALQIESGFSDEDAQLHWQKGVDVLSIYGQFSDRAALALHDLTLLQKNQTVDFSHGFDTWLANCTQGIFDDFFPPAFN